MKLFFRLFICIFIICFCPSVAYAKEEYIVTEPLGEQEVDTILKRANCFTYGYTWDDVQMKYSHDDLLSMDLSEKNRASSSLQDSVTEGVANGDFVFYFQDRTYDGTIVSWANHPYAYAGGGSNTIARSGCGPTSLAMIVATLCDNSVTPDQIADLSTAYHVSGGTSTGSMAQGLSSTFGYRCEVYPVSTAGIEQKVDECLQTGGLVLWSAGSPSPFTSGGHCMVIRGLTDNNEWLIGDPNGSHTPSHRLAVQYGITQNYNDYPFPKSVIMNAWHCDVSLIWGNSTQTGGE